MTTLVKPHPKDITSYDLLKAVAVLLMIVDHVGFYFFPDHEIFRAIGRICVPMWFFLIGYARSRDLPLKLFICIGILIAADLVTGMYFTPFSILFTIMLVRLALDKAVHFADRSRAALWTLCAVLTVTILPSIMLGEYGTQGLILAIFGFMIRRQQDARINNIEIADKTLLRDYTIFMTFIFIAWQQFAFGFATPSLIVMASGVMVTIWILSRFESKTYPDATAALPSIIVWSVQLMGRRTMEIYVAHLVLFKFAALLSGDDRFGWFDWEWSYMISGLMENA